MSTPAVKFNTQDRPEFVTELRKNVNGYFKENNISKQANTTMKVKTAFMICLYFIPLAILLSGTVNTFWPMMGIWFLMSMGMSGIGLSVMHDANHGAYSNKKTVNQFFGFLVNFLGAYHINWKIQHNVLHHSFTNVEGYDEDFENPVMRLSPSQPRKKGYKFQAFYAPFVYGLLTLNWLFSKDFKQLIDYNKKNLLVGQGLTLSKAIWRLSFYKVGYIVLTVVLPILIVDLPWWQVMLGFLMMQFISGLILALIFQPAHVIEETDFFTPNSEGSMENNWAIHQLRTTANFANGSRWFSWYVGGLNYQIEHHLFPNICHVHYRNISKIVKQTAEKYDIPYYQHRTFYDALKSHFSLLHDLGTGKYDQKLAKA
ncbi:acyl-CoA desaturase [uncultured Roseivirga sp.]|uniref:fatty acid desaturase family protein n=1 Tax=uncultured Roseivirga sp. TaxID=543088 RepID=UPI0030D7431E